MGLRIFEKTFCKVCGVNVGNQAVPLSDEQLASLSEARRGFYNMAQTLSPLNIKILNGLDWAELKEVTRITEGAAAEPQYVNP